MYIDQRSSESGGRSYAIRGLASVVERVATGLRVGRRPIDHEGDETRRGRLGKGSCCRRRNEGPKIVGVGASRAEESQRNHERTETL